MSRITKAIVWGAVIITFAIVSAMGLVENDTARTMLIILPVLAWATISGQRSCRLSLNERKENRA